MKAKRANILDLIKEIGIDEFEMNENEMQAVGSWLVWYFGHRKNRWGKIVDAKYIRHMTNQEVAAELGLSASNLNRLLHDIKNEPGRGIYSEKYNLACFRRELENVKRNAKPE